MPHSPNRTGIPQGEKELFMKVRKFAELIPTERLFVILLFGLNLFLILYRFFPTLRDLNLWDEAVYINTGKRLVEGELTSFARNPLVGLLYGLTYLPFLHSPFWMMQSAMLGRFILFGMLWLSGYLVARQLSGVLRPLVFAGFLFLFPVLGSILDNPSDALFAATSGLTFWQLLSFHHTRQTKNLWLASLFAGLSALSRNDGVTLFIILAAISLFYLKTASGKWKNLLAVLLPFALLLGGYLLVYGLVTGDFRLGVKERSYVAFQQGQVQVYAAKDGCQQSLTKCAVAEAQRIYGTPQENNNSILKAISRNPQPYFHRIVHTLGSLPEMIYTAYGKREGYLVLFLALAGIYELLRQRNFPLLGLLIGWLLYLGVYFITFFRIGYLETPYFIVFALAVIGLQAMVNGLSSRQSTLVWTAILLSLVLAGLIRPLPYLYFSMIVLSISLWFAYLYLQMKKGSADWQPAAWLILLSGVLLIRGAFNPPDIQGHGEIPEEQAVLVLQDRLPENSAVAAGAPGAAWAARMEYVGLVDPEFVVSSPAGLHEQLKLLGVRAIYVDGYLTRQNPHVWDLIESGIGEFYEEIFSGRDASIRVLLVNP
jgi:hypothetical protein